MNEKSPPMSEASNIEISAWLKENWGWLAPLIYVYVTIIGMTQSWFQFHAFKINVFEFSELNDFLLAAFREPQSFLAILLFIAYGGLATGYKSLKWKKLSSSGIGRHVKWTTNGLYISFVMVAPFYIPYQIHDGYGSEWEETFLSAPENNVQVKFRDGSKQNTNDGWMDNLVLIGTTEKFVFLYDNPNKGALIAPLSNIVFIRHVDPTNKATPEVQQQVSPNPPG